MTTPTWLSWSSGKDSAWALETLRRTDELRVDGLLTTVTTEHDRVSMHAVRRTVLERQAAAIGIPLHVVEIPSPCSNEIYQQRMTAAVERARRLGIRAMAFGDLFLADIRAYREQMLAAAGLTASFPLWGEDTTELAHTMIDAGLRAIVTCIDPRVIDASFVGRAFDHQFLADLPSGIDPCGERGEFHTFAWDGPMFREPVPVSVGRQVEREGFVFADLLVK